MKNWKTTVGGAGLAATTAIVGIVNYHELTPLQLSIIASIAISQFIFGIWAADRVSKT